jgi:hypothetical protein
MGHLTPICTIEKIFEYGMIDLLEKSVGVEG